MRTDLFDFELPDSAIALEPATPRDSARLLVVPPGAAVPLEHHVVRDLPKLLLPSDVIVLNDTRVIPAALEGTRTRGDGPSARIAFTLIKRVDDNSWRAFARPAKRLEPGDRIRFGHDGDVCLLGRLEATVAAKLDAGEVELAFDLRGTFLDDAIETIGEMPLPPYIALKRETRPADAEHYQTVFGTRPGAVAAPTAGLHLTHDLLAALSARGIEHHFVTLHVGAGTFLPVKTDDTADHVMHSEWGEVSDETAAALNAARTRGARIVAIGTTALRILESAARADRTIAPFRGDTAIFITPGYRFKAVDVLLTNFHLPRSTLFMLVSAFAGLERMRAAYAHALNSGYRFFSYGDATLLTRDPAISDQGATTPR